MKGKDKSQYKTFEEIKQINELGQEFWWACDLQSVLEYGRWEKFTKIIEKAVIVCQKAGQDENNHFLQVGKMAKLQYC